MRRRWFDLALVFWSCSLPASASFSNESAEKIFSHSSDKQQSASPTRNLWRNNTNMRALRVVSGAGVSWKLFDTSKPLDCASFGQRLMASACQRPRRDGSWFVYRYEQILVSTVRLNEAFAQAIKAFFFQAVLRAVGSSFFLGDFRALGRRSSSRLRHVGAVGEDEIAIVVMTRWWRKQLL